MTETKQPLFIINSALCVTGLSVFDTETRVNHTLGTLHSIHQHFGEDVGVLILDMSPVDGSELEPHLYQIQEFKKKNLPNLHLAHCHSDTSRQLGTKGHRSLAELASFYYFFTDEKINGGWYSPNNIADNYSRVYKLSGRYRLSTDFQKGETITVPLLSGGVVDCSIKNKFVFAEKLPTWMSPDQVDSYARPPFKPDFLYRLRLWHMDANLMPKYYDMIHLMYVFCSEGMDIEHAFYMALKEKQLENHILELPKIGVQGFIAPSGEFIDE